MEELHHGLPQRHLLSVGGRPAVAPLDQPRTGLFTPLQPPDVRHTSGERHGAIIDGIQKGDPFWLPRYLRGHGSRRGEAPRLRKPRARSNPRARKRAARAVEPARPERAAAGPGAWEFPRTAPKCGAPQLDLVRLPPKPITKRWLVCAPRVQCGSAKTLTPKPRTGVPQACYTSNTRYGNYRAHSALEPKRFVLGKT